MHAVVGDRIVTPGLHVGDTVRSGEVLEVRGLGTDLLYVIRWDDGHQGLCSPGAETRVQPRPTG